MLLTTCQLVQWDLAYGFHWPLAPVNVYLQIVMFKELLHHLVLTLMMTCIKTVIPQMLLGKPFIYCIFSGGLIYLFQSSQYIASTFKEFYCFLSPSYLDVSLSYIVVSYYSLSDPNVLSCAASAKHTKVSTLIRFVTLGWVRPMDHLLYQRDGFRRALPCPRFGS